MDLYSRKEIANVLRAVANTDEAGQRELGESETLVQSSYHRGVQDALVSVGFGFDLHQMVSKERQDGLKWVEMDRGAGQ